MQTLKDEVRQRILDEAREEFLEHGYQKSSLRRIAEAASLSAGNVYTYFKSKDRLFTEVMRPVTSIIMDHFDSIGKEGIEENRHKWTYEYHLKIIPILARFIDDNREMLELLVFKSYGSSLEKFKDEVIDLYTQQSLGFMEKAREVFPEIRDGISHFCMHNIASFGFTAITEILMHNIQHEEMITYMQEIMAFMYFGYQGAMGCSFDEIASRLR